MNKPKLVIFDMDGLIFNTEEMGSQTLRRAAKEMGYTITDELLLSLIGGNMVRNTQLLQEALGEECAIDELRQRSGKYREEHFAKYGLEIKSGLKELIAYLKAEKINIAIASSSGRATIEHYLEVSQLEDTFDYIISGDKVTHSKPHPEIFLNACEHFSVLPQDALVLEDSKNGVLAAHNGNIPVICVPDLIFHDHEIFSMCEAMVPSLLDVIDILRGIEVKLAIFDMDGLMFDTEYLCIEPMIRANQANGYPMTKEICFKLIGTSGKIAREILLAEFGQDYPFDTLNKLSFEMMWKDIEINGLPIKKGLIELLNHLQTNNIPCVIASSSSTTTIEKYLEMANLRHYFKGIVGGNMVSVSKPEPDIFNKACELYSVLPNEALVLEDSKNGIIASNRAGIPVVCVPDLLMHDQTLLEQTKMFIPDLGKLVEIIK